MNHAFSRFANRVCGGPNEKRRGAVGNGLVPASARAARSPPSNRLPHGNAHAGPRNQTPRCGTAKESPQSPRVAAAWSGIKLAAVCSLWTGTSCAARLLKLSRQRQSLRPSGRRACPFTQSARTLFHQPQPFFFAGIMAAPLGGTLLILGWVLVALAALAVLRQSDDRKLA
jgi:hypothetical protein